MVYVVITNGDVLKVPGGRGSFILKGGKSYCFRFALVVCYSIGIDNILHDMVFHTFQHRQDLHNFQQHTVWTDIARFSTEYLESYIPLLSWPAFPTIAYLYIKMETTSQQE